jgi:hypothetical protein
MVPQHTNDPVGPPRGLSPEVERELEDALRELSGEASVSPRLTKAIQAAGHDARRRALRSDELLLAFKAIEARVGPLADVEYFQAPISRTRLIRALIEAYYAPDR